MKYKDEFTKCRVDPRVLCGGNSAVRGPANEADSWVDWPCELVHIDARSVVDDNCLDRYVVLSECAVYRMSRKVGSIVRRNNDGDGGYHRGNADRDAD